MSDNATVEKETQRSCCSKNDMLKVAAECAKNGGGSLSSENFEAICVGGGGGYYPAFTKVTRYIIGVTCSVCAKKGSFSICRPVEHEEG